MIGVGSNRIEAGSAGPTPLPERIVALDLLRGVAVLGILITNIQHFAMFAGTTRDPTLWGNLDGANYWVYALTYTLAYQRFLPVFAMLFGAGVLLTSERREAVGLNPAAFHYRRMFFLLLIGAVHAYLIWYGDILVAYAVCGMVVFRLRRRSAGLLVGLGIGLLAISPLVRIVFFILPSILGAGGGEGASIPPEQIVAEDLAAFRGTWLEAFRTRASYAWEAQSLGLVVVLFWRVCGLMAIGMGLFKLGVLTGRRSRSVYLALIAIAMFVALPLIVLGFVGCATSDWKNYWLRFMSEQVVYFFGVVVSLGWASLVILAGRAWPRARVWRPLGAVGRMALSNYLLQSLLCTLFFYGYGLGFYGSVERTGQVLVVLSVWVLQLTLSPLWLRYFRFGPAEWLWRSLSYGKLQPFRA